MRPTEYCKTLSTRVAQRLNIGNDRVAEVITAYNDQIRHLPAANETEKAASLSKIMIVVGQVARDYGANHAIHPDTYQECVKLVLDKFSYLSLSEIRAAYRMYSAGEIKAKGADMYGGKFNAAQLGKILAAYSADRKPILGNYLRMKEDQTFKEKQTARDEMLKQRFESTFLPMIEKAREEYITFEQVPEYWYKSALDRGLFSITSEEGKQIKALADKVTVFISQQERAANLLAAVKSPGNFESRSKVIARKIAVWEKLIRNDGARTEAGTNTTRHKGASEIFAAMQAQQASGATADTKQITKTSL